MRIFIVLVLALSACSSSNNKSESSNAQSTQQTATPKATDGTEPGAAPSAQKVDVLDPATATLEAPAEYTAKLETTKGEILIDVKREWAPQGADRFYNLIKAGYFEDVAFFRVIDGFMAQVGIHGDPSVSKAWKDANITDDPVKASNTRGTVSFATAGPNTRTTQFFINFGDNARLDDMGFSPFGKVRDMKAVDALYSGYGEGAPSGNGPSQGQIESEGNAYLKRDFPKLDYIERASIVE